ncbi:MAG: hypothetical protein Q7R83_04750 [bacterium]|nr:hypothetical protein [bacterium]
MKRPEEISVIGKIDEKLPPQIVEVSEPMDPLLAPAYELLSKNLPQHELVDLPIIQEALANKTSFFPDRYHFLVFTERQEVQGVAVGYYLARVNVGLIYYLATKNKGSGFGTVIRDSLIAKFKDDATSHNGQLLSGVVGEVEKTNPWLVKLKARGALLLDVNYFQPSIREGAPVTPLILYYQPISESVVEIDTATVIELVKTIYQDVYDIENPENCPEFQLMLKSLGSRPFIGTKKEFL